MFDWFTKKDAEEITSKILEEEKNDGEDFVKIRANEEDIFIGKNIYDAPKNTKDFHKRATFVHKILKNSFVDVIVNHFIKKHRDDLVKELPDEYQFMKLNMFSRAVDGALKDYEESFLCFNTPKTDPKLVDIPNSNIKIQVDINKRVPVEGDVVDRIRLVKQLYLTICSNDTAALEFHNLLMYNLAKEMKNLPSDHLMFISHNINDPTYFMAVGNWTPETRGLAHKLVNDCIVFAEVKDNMVYVKERAPPEFKIKEEK